MSPARAVHVALALLVVIGGAARASEAISPRLADLSADERFYAVLADGIAEHGHYGDRSRGPFRPFHAHRARRSPSRRRPRSRRRRTRASDIPAAYWLLAAAGTALIVASFGLARAIAGDGRVGRRSGGRGLSAVVRTTGEALGRAAGARSR